MKQPKFRYSKGRIGNVEFGVGWKIAGQSVQGRQLRVATYGHGPRRVLWVGGIHGNEREGAVATAELPRAVLALAVVTNLALLATFKYAGWLAANLNALGLPVPVPKLWRSSPNRPRP